MIMCSSSRENEITLAYLPHSIEEYFQKADLFPVTGMIPPSGIELKELLLKIEEAYFRKSLDLAKGNKTKAAKLLGIYPAAFKKALRERFGEE